MASTNQTRRPYDGPGLQLELERFRVLLDEGYPGHRFRKSVPVFAPHTAPIVELLWSALGFSDLIGLVHPADSSAALRLEQLIVRSGRRSRQKTSGRIQLPGSYRVVLLRESLPGWDAWITDDSTSDPDPMVVHVGNGIAPNGSLDDDLTLFTELASDYYSTFVANTLVTAALLSRRRCGFVARQVNHRRRPFPLLCPNLEEADDALIDNGEVAGEVNALTSHLYARDFRALVRAAHGVLPDECLSVRVPEGAIIRVEKFQRSAINRDSPIRWIRAERGTSLRADADSEVHGIGAVAQIPIWIRLLEHDPTRSLGEVIVEPTDAERALSYLRSIRARVVTTAN